MHKVDVIEYHIGVLAAVHSKSKSLRQHALLPTE